ncbi:MAG: triose-phosphate isomerase [Gammaproteobacteria bacterium]|nr:triose-phosphate isomerase [Gammaproteobacteria bacterium]
MRRPLVAGNWKMHGSRARVDELLTALRAGAAGLSGVDVAVCPPFVHLAAAAQHLAGSSIVWGAQDVCDRNGEGAFTGEISGDMLRDFGCSHAIVGHSERRHVYGEGDALTAAKLVAALSASLTPILCVGELLEERELNATEMVVERQLLAVIAALDDVRTLARVVIAYEPVWAIGTGRTATPEQAQEVHAFIRSRIAREDEQTAAKVRILYGGSVKASNAAELFAMEDIDGGLIGGASLQADEFLAICGAAQPG